MNTKFIKIPLLVFLYIALAIFSLVMLVIPIISISMLISDFSFSMLANVLFSLMYFFNYFMVIRKLVSILKSIDDTPFVIDNVKSFKIMGYCLGVNSIFECIMGYSGDQDTGNIQILATNSGAFTPVMIVCIVSALMCFVIAEVFNRAIRIKEDNDLTI